MAVWVNITNEDGALLTRGYIGDNVSPREIEDLLINKYGMTPDKEDWELLSLSEEVLSEDS